MNNNQNVKRFIIEPCSDTQNPFVGNQAGKFNIIDNGSLAGVGTTTNYWVNLADIEQLRWECDCLLQDAYYAQWQNQAQILERLEVMNALEGN